MKNIVAIDQSTSGTKVLLVNSEAKIIQKASMSHEQIYPSLGWVEHDPIEIYENVRKLLLEMDVKKVDVLSITNQRETIVIWDKKTGIPVYNAIVWQCRRTSNICEDMKLSGYEEKIKEKTGLTLDPYFSATKIKWILDNVKNARIKANSGKLLLGTIDSWLIWKLTNKKSHFTDYTNASRTLLFNIHTLRWDEELLKLFDIPMSMMPEVKSSSDIYGMVEDDLIEKYKDVPISGIIGDSQGSLFAQKCFKKGMAKATYGTGTSVLVYTENFVKSQNGLVTTLAWSINKEVKYALEGIIHSTGDTINWLKNELELIIDYKELENLANDLKDNQGVYLVPAFVGLGAPYWKPYARAAIMGMQRKTTKAHIARAALESIAYQVKDVVNLIEEESSIKVNQLNVDGGATINKFLMEFQANILDTNVCVSNISELSAMGSIYLAGLGIGLFKSIEEINKLNNETTIYQPNIKKELVDEWYDGWLKSVNSIIEKTK